MERSEIRDKIRGLSNTGATSFQGAPISLTVTIADRTSSAMVHHVGALRMAFRIARHARPFTIDARAGDVEGPHDGLRRAAELTSDFA
jgi:hypothetical protein